MRKLISKALLALLKNVVTNTLSTWKRDQCVILLCGNAKHIGDASCEAAALAVLDVHNLERTNMLLTSSNHTNAALILTLGDAACGGRSRDGEPRCCCCCCCCCDSFASGNVQFDSIVHFAVGVWVTDGAAIVGSDVRHTLGTPRQPLHTAKLVFGFRREVFVVQPVHDEPTLGIVEHAEVFIGLLDGDDIHEATGVVGIGANLAVDFDETLHQDLLYLLFGQGVLETITQNQHERQALTQLVGARRGTGSPGATHLVQHPVLWGSEALQMLLWSTSHC